MLSMGGIAMMIGLGAGAWIGLKYLLWELEHLPAKPLSQKHGSEPFLGINWDRVQPYIGTGVVVAVIAAFYAYSTVDKAQIGGLLFLGFLIGLVMHRARFCFVRAFRCPFMTGEAEMVKVVAMSLMIYGMGSAIIKWAWIKDPMTGVYHPFFLGSLAGGLIFGVGMILAGGVCQQYPVANRRRASQAGHDHDWLCIIQRVNIQGDCRAAAIRQAGQSHFHARCVHLGSNDSAFHHILCTLGVHRHLE
jgi:uncharacterized membrane protein YedE/YeeE